MKIITLINSQNRHKDHRELNKARTQKKAAQPKLESCRCNNRNNSNPENFHLI